MHLNALTHNDIHIHNILVKDVTAEGSNAFFLDTLAVKKRNNRTLFSLLDIGKFYFWMQNDKKDSYLLPKEREYILKEYYKQTSDIYPFNYCVFRFMIKVIAMFIKKTYNLNRSIRNIQ